MQDINEILGKPKLMMNDLAELRYLSTQGSADDAGERMMMVDRALWRIVSDPNYEGDITLEDL